jgi:DNA-binding GntR family transcriptional regulator
LLNALEPSTNSVADLLVEQIRHDILFAILPEGLTLSTSFLEKQYGGSPAYLIEALQKLKLQGLVILNEQRNYQVSKASNKNSHCIIQERIKLESIGLETSIKNGNIHWQAMILTAHNHWLDSCKLTQQDPKCAAVDFEENIKLFHQKLISACGSTSLMSQQDKLYQQTRSLRVAKLQSPDTNLEEYAQIAKTLMTQILAKEIQPSITTLEKLINFT